MKANEQTLAQPVRSLQTMLRTLTQTGSPIPLVVPDGVYGEDTAAAVRAFQQQSGLPVTGEADFPTWNAIADAYRRALPDYTPPEPLLLVWPRTLRIAPGTANYHLFLVQALFYILAQLFDNVPAVTLTGVHDGPTVDAVQWLQALAGLPADGYFGKREWKHLAKLYRVATYDGTHS